MRSLKPFGNEGGMVLVFVAIVLVVLIGMAALAIDVGQMFIAKQRAQNVCDAAALAGGQFLTGSSDCTQQDDQTAVSAQQCAVANNDVVAPWLVRVPGDTTSGVEVTFPDGTFPEGTVTDDAGNPITVVLGEAIRTRGYVRVNFGFARIFGIESTNVSASATAILEPKKNLYSNLLIPILFSNQITGEYDFGESAEFGTVDEWRDGFLGPGNWLSCRFEGDQGEADYIGRLSGDPDMDPAYVALGDYLNLEPGGASGEGTGSKTYDGLIGTFTGGTSPRLKEPGRILKETNARYAVDPLNPTHDLYTGYNPDAWTNWLADQDPETLQYPYSQRIVILPVIEDTDDIVSGNSTPVKVVGMVAFFIERVYDGNTYDEDGVLRLRGDIKGYFIQAIIGEDMNDPNWCFPPDGEPIDIQEGVRRVRLIS